MNNTVVLFSALALTLLIASCLPEDQAPGTGPDFSTELLVDTGRTYGELVAGESSTFTLRWTAADDAEWYDIRISPHPINDSNWDTALRIDSIPASDTTDMIAYVQVQPEVFANTCISCGLCVEACPQDAMSLIDGKAVIDLSKCTACGECVKVCPVNAITDSRFGQSYYFAMRAMGSGNTQSEVVSASGSYRLRYMNLESWCGNCAYNCFILLPECGPGCPVDAIWYTPAGQDSGLVHIDYDLCIDCGQCYIQCHEYGQWSIMKEVVAE
ncbi:MAG: 4Fe-4S dicluster domain-containing protein [Candidatus Aegiribacteria sp.]|nr:4Fe-4S dicluster domain-containing protein [Candidatus Aegiribacteria sp.]